MDEESAVPPGLVRALSTANVPEKKVSTVKSADRSVVLTSLMGAESQLSPGAEDLLRLMGLTHAQVEDEKYVRERIDQAHLGG